MYLLSAFADEYASDFNEQLIGLQRNSLQFVEVRNADGVNVAHWTEFKALEIAEKLKNNHICVSAIGSPLGKISADCEMSDYANTIENVCNIADILSCSLIRIFSFYRPAFMPDMEYKSAVFKRLEMMLAIADKHKKQLCLENEGGLYGESPEKCAELLDYFGGKLNCCFDMGNFRLQGYDPFPVAYELLKKYIAYFHIKDSFDHGAIVPAGCGEAKIKEILTAYSHEYKHDYFVSIEPHLVTFDGLSELTSEHIEHQFVYDNKEDAFGDAILRFKTLMQ